MVNWVKDIQALHIAPVMKNTGVADTIKDVVRDNNFVLSGSERANQEHSEWRDFSLPAVPILISAPKLLTRDAISASIGRARVSSSPKVVKFPFM